jgi:hypothetical protein
MSLFLLATAALQTRSGFAKFVHRALKIFHILSFCITRTPWSRPVTRECPRGPMDKAPAYGAGDSRFDPGRGYVDNTINFCTWSAIKFLAPQSSEEWTENPELSLCRFLPTNAYRQAYADNQNISFLPAIMSTSNRMHGEFLRLLFLQAHRETGTHFTAAGMPSQRNQSASFRFKRAAFYQGLKSKVGLAAAKAAALRINLNVQGCSIVAAPMHAPAMSLEFAIQHRSLS